MNNPATQPESKAHVQAATYMLCISGQGDRLSVLKGKLYRVLPPHPHDREHDLRVVDETGEDYLYDRSWFVAIDLPPAAVAAMEAA